MPGQIAEFVVIEIGAEIDQHPGDQIRPTHDLACGGTALAQRLRAEAAEQATEAERNRHPLATRCQRGRAPAAVRIDHQHFRPARQLAEGPGLDRGGRPGLLLADRNEIAAGRHGRRRAVAPQAEGQAARAILAPHRAEPIHRRDDRGQQGCAACRQRQFAPDKHDAERRAGEERVVTSSRPERDRLEADAMQDRLDLAAQRPRALRLGRAAEQQLRGTRAIGAGAGCGERGEEFVALCQQILRLVSILVAVRDPVAPRRDLCIDLGQTTVQFERDRRGRADRFQMQGQRRRDAAQGRGFEDCARPIGTRLGDQFGQRPADRIQVRSLGRNCGKAEAVRSGVLHVASLARYPLIGYWDADLSTPLDEIDHLLEALTANPRCTLALGSRVKRLGSAIERRAVRHVLGRIFAACASAVLGVAVYDSQCGAKIFRAGVVPTLFGDPFITRWLFDLEMLVRLRNQAGAAIGEMTIEVPLRNWREVSGSKLRPRDLIAVPMELVTIRERYKVRP